MDQAIDELAEDWRALLTGLLVVIAALLIPGCP